MKLRYGIGIAAAVSAFVLATATPALAIDFHDSAQLDTSQVNDKRCYTQAICLFEHADFKGRVGYYEVGDRDMSDNAGPVFSNMTTSILNGSPYKFCIWDKTNYDYRSLYAEIPPRSYTTWIGTEWNDKISSLKRC